MIKSCPERAAFLLCGCCETAERVLYGCYKTCLFEQLYALEFRTRVLQFKYIF